MPANDTQHATAIYLDVEFTCWNQPPPVGMKPEIIEIGIVEMDLLSLRITREAAFFVRPRQWDISSKCTELTGITKEDIRAARPFPEVLTALTRIFEPASKLCGTWGEDADLIAETCGQHGLKSPLRNLIDVGAFFQRAFLMKQQIGLRNAVEMVGLKFDGMPHSALPDARNTAQVHAALIRRMRREADPPLPSISKSTEPPPKSDFAEALSRCLETSSMKQRELQTPEF